MTILGIETSCDETSIGIVEEKDGKLLVKTNVVATSLQLHAKTGGIIPEMAAREQVKYMLPVLEQAFKEGLQTTLQFSPTEKIPIDAIAVTYGPGLIGSLLVGVETAKTLSYIWKKPLIPINHMLGHIYANWLTTEDQKPTITQFPALVLVVSGGHTDLILMKNHGDMRVVGATRDDAAGECFDKCARLLGYPYPGGPKIAQLASFGNHKSFLLPRPMLDSNNYDFSFSGLKTAFIRLTMQHFPLLRTEMPQSKAGWQQITPFAPLTDKQKQIVYDLCASLETAIVDVLVKKTIRAALELNVQSILLSGGVASNDLLRHTLQTEMQKQYLTCTLAAPHKIYCTDNGAMIAAAAAFNYHPIDWKDVTVNPELYY